MADDTIRDEDTGTDTGTAPRVFGEHEPAGQSGGINQGTTPALTPEQEAVQRQRMATGDLVDDNAASHQGGMGAQSGQTDFGSAGNLAGTGIRGN